MSKAKNSNISELATRGIPNEPDRREFLHRGIVATATLAGPWLGVSQLAEIAQGASPKRPNIVFIMADDMGYGDPGCYGQDKIKTPNMDRLAKGGMKFTEAYAGGTVCTPSRSCLMTGTHGGHTSARDNIPHFHTYLKESDVTVAEVLKKAGYRCGAVGKWSLGTAGSASEATKRGFGMFFGYLDQDHAHWYYTNYLDDNNSKYHMPGNRETHSHYSQHLIADRALEFIRQSKDQPFFLYGAFTLPHFGKKQEDPTQLPVPSDEPYHHEEWPQKAKNYAAMITLFDKDIGRVVDLLDELGIRENTLTIVTSDNGPWAGAVDLFDSNGPLRGHKRDMYEGGIRVPFIANWPGTIPADTTSNDVIAFWDMLPTFTELAGAEPPDNIDGHSIAAALRGKGPVPQHDYLYWDYGHCRHRYDQAVRMGKWKGIRLGKDGAIQLYDLSVDVGETNNVAEEHPDIVKRIARVMETAVIPSERYPVGRIYKGAPVWKPL
jgi:arylsulfatase A-like enzyme